MTTADTTDVTADLDTVRVTRADWHHAVQVMAANGELKKITPSARELIGLAAGHYKTWGSNGYGQIEIAISRVQNLLQCGSRNTAIDALAELQRVGLWTKVEPKNSKKHSGRRPNLYALSAPTHVLEEAQRQRDGDTVAARSEDRSSATDDALRRDPDPLAARPGSRSNAHNSVTPKVMSERSAVETPPAPPTESSSSAPAAIEHLRSFIERSEPNADLVSGAASFEDDTRGIDALAWRAACYWNALETYGDDKWLTAYLRENGRPWHSAATEASLRSDLNRLRDRHERNDMGYDPIEVQRARNEFWVNFLELVEIDGPPMDLLDFTDRWGNERTAAEVTSVATFERHSAEIRARIEALDTGR